MKKFDVVTMNESTTSLRDKFERESRKQQNSEKPKIPTKPVDPQGENIAASKKFFEAKIKAEKPKVIITF
jgi:uracil-DNA glycosylase